MQSIIFDLSQDVIGIAAAPCLPQPKEEELEIYFL
jgi:hypothetical protein